MGIFEVHGMRILVPRPQCHHVCIFPRRCCSANKIARPLIALSVQASMPCCWRVSAWLACCIASGPFGGTSARFGSVTSYMCARRTARTASPHRSGSSMVHGLSRVPLQAQQSITNSDLRLLVTVRGSAPGVLCIFDVGATSLSQLHVTAAANQDDSRIKCQQSIRPRASGLQSHVESAMV